MSQLLLFPDPRPLVERLGSEFFKQAPDHPGVYLMRDANDTVLYVGKAKNLRTRLGSYRVANPDRLRKRHLRLLRAVARIQLERCPDEKTALAREAELLLALRPRFNRAGTWKGPHRFVVWKTTEKGLVVAVTEEAPVGWHFHGPMASGALSLRAAMVRLCWYAIHREDSYCWLPEGWFHRLPGSRAMVTIPRGQTELGDLERIALRLRAACEGEAAEFIAWISERTSGQNYPFDVAARNKDLEELERLKKQS